MNFAELEKTTPKPDNAADSAALRHYRDLLRGSGTGVIMFAVWSLLRTVMTFIISRNTGIDMFLTTDAEGAPELDMLPVMIAIFIFIIAIELGIRLFVGLSARAEGKGRKKSMLYIIIACIMIPIYIAAIVFGIISATGGTMNVLDTVISLCVEVTSVLAYIELVVSGIKVKRLTKKKSLANA